MNIWRAMVCCDLAGAGYRLLQEPGFLFQWRTHISVFRECRSPAAALPAVEGKTKAECSKYHCMSSGIILREPSRKTFLYGKVRSVLPRMFLSSKNIMNWSESRSQNILMQGERLLRSGGSVV